MKERLEFRVHPASVLQAADVITYTLKSLGKEVISMRLQCREMVMRPEDALKLAALLTQAAHEARKHRR